MQEKVNRTHTEIQLARMTNALRSLVDWYEMDHETTEPSKLQEVFDAAIERAKEVLRDAQQLNIHVSKSDMEGKPDSDTKCKPYPQQVEFFAVDVDARMAALDAKTRNSNRK